MQDLNDLYYFALVVEHGGFAAAERAQGIPKSRLSRRISQLETELGVRLLQRSTYGYGVSGIPMTFFIDHEGNLVSGKSGMISEADLDRRIQTILG